MLKTFEVNLDLENQTANSAFTISQNDLKTIEIIFTVTQDKKAVDLTGTLPRIAILKPSGKTVIQDCTLDVDPTKGNFQVILDSQAYVEVGVHTCEVYIYSGDQVAVTGTFTYNSRIGIFSDTTLTSSNDWQAINDALANYMTNDQAKTLIDSIIAQNGGVNLQNYYTKTDVDTQMSLVNEQLAERTMNVVSVESFPKIVPEVDDSGRIQRAISSLGTSGGTVVLKNIVYTVNTTTVIPSNVTLMGAGPLATKVVAGNNNMTVMDMGHGSLRASISNLWVDGGGFTGVTGINVAGTSSAESLHGKVEFVWIDGCQTGVTGGYSYFVKFDTVRINGTVNGFSLTAASNSITLINCALFCTSTGLTWNNSSGLTIIGCTFEDFSPINVYTCQGVTIEGCYFENTGGSVNQWITLGNAVGGSADGISIHGNLFNVGASYGLLVIGCTGLDVEGNYFHTTAAAFQWYQSDNAPKRNIKIGNNSYNINGAGYDPTKIIAYSGATFDSLNCNLNADQVQPILFNQQTEPQPSSIGNNQGAVYFDGTDLILKKKDGSGTVKKQKLTGNYGAATLAANQTSVVVNHNLGVQPSSITVTPNSAGMGGFWVDTVGLNTFTLHVPTGIGNNTYFYWRVDV